MTTPRTIENYGAPAGGFIDLLPVEDPEGEQSSAYANRQMEDTAQMTRTTDRAIVRFPTSSASAPASVTPTDGRSHYGTGPSQLPTVQKVSTGRYTITYAASFTDALGQAEAVAFWAPSGRVESLTTAGHVQCTVTGNVVNVAVFDMAGTLSDLGGSVQIAIEAK